MTSVVIVSQDAEPSGLTQHALDLAGWIRSHRPEVVLHVVLLRGGPLVHQLQALAPTTVIEWDDPRRDNEAAALVLRSRVGRQVLGALVDTLGATLLRRRLPRADAGVTYLNGLAAVEVGPVLGRPRNVQLARLPDVAETRLRRLPRRARRRLGRTGPVLVPSSSARRALAATGVPEDRIVVHSRAAAAAGSERRRRTGPAVVAGWGSAGWAGGADLFVRSAWLVRREAPELDVTFRWGGCSRRDLDRITEQARSIGLAGGVGWMGDGDVHRVLGEIDVFVATDRDVERGGGDLVAGAPHAVVAFDDDAPAADTGARRSVAYGDVVAMARTIIKLCGPVTSAGTGAGVAGAVAPAGTDGPGAAAVWALIERCHP